VSNVLESGPGSFRQALEDSNASLTDGPDLITFDKSVFGTVPQTISILTALPTVQDNLTIQGPGSKLLTINRNASADAVRILKIENTSAVTTVSISGLTLAGGNHVAASGAQIDNGGGLYTSNEEVTLTDVAVINNTSNAQGGGIAVGPAGRLTMVNCTVSGNTAAGLVNGDPFGLGFSGVGGGIYFTTDGVLTMTNCTVSGNSAKYRGGGIYLYGDTSASAVLRNCTISNNKTTSFFSGGFFASGGGGVSATTNPLNGAQFALTMQNCTVYQNTVAAGAKGGGLLTTGKTAVNAESTVIASNSAGTAPDISSATTVTLNTSAVGVAGTGSGFSFTGSNNITGTTATPLNVKLGPLADNGGPTLTHLPQFDLAVAGNNSPLIDAGSNPSGLSADQRVLARSFDNPAVGGTRTVDIGAVEAQPAGLPTAVAVADNITAAGGTTHTVTVTFADDVAVNVATLGSGDITVTGPAGFNATPTFAKVDVNTNGSPRVATYTFAPPGGTWDAADAGNYSVSVVAGQVTDTAGNAVPAGVVGTFKVLLPRTLVVTNGNASGPGSLRQAILDANALSASQDVITFNSLFNTPQTILLSSSMAITDSVKIIGPGATLLTLDGNFATRHLVIDGPGVLNVEISGLSLNNGRTTENFQSERGGSVYVNGENVTMTNVFLAGNAAMKSYGGAIHLQGQAQLTFANGRITGNSAPQFGGGGISALDAGHAITITDSLISGNSAGYFGGGVFSFAAGSVTIARTTLNNNSTTIYDDQGGTVFGGGGLMMGDGVTAGALTITDSTFDANQTVGYGGAIVFSGATPGMTVRNSTIVNNKSNTQTNGVAGGVLVGNLFNTPVLFENCTFAFNQSYSGGGLFVGNNDGASVVARSSIFAQNLSADPTQLPPDIDGALLAEFCLIGIEDGAGLDPNSTGNLTGTMAAGALDPLYGSLDFNGGPTRTLSLQPGSPAIDTGANAAGLAFDQRGVGFPRVSGAAADIGAYELQVATPPGVADFKVNDGAVQRSRVTSLTVTFSTLVTLGGGTPEQAFQLQRTGPGTPVDNVGLIVDLSGSTPTQTIAKITFAGPLTQSGGTLIDGAYTLTVFAAAVLDGGNTPMAADVTENLHRLFGDSDGDRDVDAQDFVAFRGAFGGTSNLAMDSDGDGDVDAADFVAFRARFGSAIP